MYLLTVYTVYLQPIRQACIAQYIHFCCCHVPLKMKLTDQFRLIAFDKELSKFLKP